MRQHFQYTNHGYIIAQLIVSRLSGKSLAEYVHDELFQPLGMHSSTYDRKAALDSGNRVQGYVRMGREPEKVKEMIEDSSKWDAAALGEPVPIPFWSQGDALYFHGPGGIWTSPNDLVRDLSYN